MKTLDIKRFSTGEGLPLGSIVARILWNGIANSPNVSFSVLEGTKELGYVSIEEGDSYTAYNSTPADNNTYKDPFGLSYNQTISSWCGRKTLLETANQMAFPSVDDISILNTNSEYDISYTINGMETNTRGGSYTIFATITCTPKALQDTYSDTISYYTQRGMFATADLVKQSNGNYKISYVPTFSSSDLEDYGYTAGSTFQGWRCSELDPSDFTVAELQSLEIEPSRVNFMTDRSFWAIVNEPVVLPDVTPMVPAATDRRISATIINNDTTYPFDFNSETGVYTSTNRGIDSSTATIVITPNITKPTKMAIAYKISSEGSNIDYASFTIGDEFGASFGGEVEDKYQIGTIQPNTNITVSYIKDSSVSSGEDCVQFYLTEEIENKGSISYKDNNKWNKIINIAKEDVPYIGSLVSGPISWAAVKRQEEMTDNKTLYFLFEKKITSPTTIEIYGGWSTQGENISAGVGTMTLYLQNGSHLYTKGFTASAIRSVGGDEGDVINIYPEETLEVYTYFTYGQYTENASEQILLNAVLNVDGEEFTISQTVSGLSGKGVKYTFPTTNSNGTELTSKLLCEADNVYFDASVFAIEG